MSSSVGITRTLLIAAIYKALGDTASILARKFFLNRWRRGEGHLITHTHAMGPSINYTFIKSLLSDSSHDYLAGHVRAYAPRTRLLQL